MGLPWYPGGVASNKGERIRSKDMHELLLLLLLYGSCKPGVRSGDVCLIVALDLNCCRFSIAVHQSFVTTHAP